MVNTRKGNAKAAASGPVTIAALPPMATMSDYQIFIRDIKNHIQCAQIKAATAVNQALLHLYWDMGKKIVAKQQAAVWGDGFLVQMSRDLTIEFPDIKGFSKRNLELMRQWYRFWADEPAIAKQLASQLPASENDLLASIFQIPWWHNIVIFRATKNQEEALFYVQKTIQNNWSRTVLTHHIESGLYQREGKAITNFDATLPAHQSDLARQLLKDPYHFDFLMLREKHDEQELENALLTHITRFLLELGAGFSYLGRQYRLEIAGDEFFMDLLFYHVRLHCYVVIELKTVKFKPEFAGKLNFYISSVDAVLKTEHDQPTIGILICKSKNDTVVEYTLRDVDKPIGVSEYTILRQLPDSFRSSLPTIEEIEAELGGCDDMAFP